MRILFATLFLFTTTLLSGQCLNVQVDSVFCNPNGGYSFTFDVEGTGDSGWTVFDLQMIGGYNTDEIFFAGPFFEDVTVLQFVDLSDNRCSQLVTIDRPADCSPTDPCFGFAIFPQVRVDSFCQSTILLQFQGGISPYQVELTRQGSVFVRDGVMNPSAFFEGLSPGVYLATVIDDRQCVSDVTVVVEGDPNCNGGDCFVQLVVDNAGCGGNSGTVTAIPGGQAPFTYLWSNGATTPVITDLTPGNYSITVTDAAGCEAINQVFVGQSQGLSISLQEIGSTCEVNDTTHYLDALVFGGVQPYVYEYRVGNEVVGTNQILLAPVPGTTYVLTVTDANGCTGTTQWTATGGSGNQTINWFAPFFLACDGSGVEISTGDSSGVYEYVWDTPSGETLVGPSIVATESGVYGVVGTAVNGASCRITGTALVESSALDASYEIITIDSLECGGQRCMYVFAPDATVWRPDIIYTWLLPDGSSQVAQQGGWICTEAPGLYVVQISNTCDTITQSIILEENTQCAALNGTVYIDYDANCSLDAGDTPAAGVLVEIRGVDNGALYYEITDADGRYGTDVLVGTYTVHPMTDPTQPFGTCEPPATATVVFDSPTELDVFLPALADCPLLTTSVAVPFLRRCFRSNAYVAYANVGSATATDAQLTVTLDEFLINVESDIPASSQDGNTFVFNLGDLPPFADGRIWFSFTVSCEASLGQIHCVEAAITPDDNCTTPEGWNGALVNVETPDCNGDSLTFAMSNVGDNPMTVPLTYVVVEDGIMMTPVPVVVRQLAAGEIFTLNLPADGQTYQVITNQEPNAPASATPTAMAEGCVVPAGDGFSTGLANILALGNGVPSQAIECRENVGAYDPNDKNGYPLGYGAENNIPEGTRLNYAIRFQNTGTDTAFNVVIKDTISMALDLATFKEESASHRYTIDIDTHRVVTFTFPNIMLPDSNVNLAASQGVVNFSIQPSAALEPGDYIFNEADIYFDFNEPIRTNRSRHRIEVEGLPTGVRNVQAQQVSLVVYPNPGNGLLQLQVPNRDVKLTDVLTVTDLYGRRLATTTYEQLGNAWDVRHLPAGYYLLVVTDQNGNARGRTGFVVAK